MKYFVLYTCVYIVVITRSIFFFMFLYVCLVASLGLEIKYKALDNDMSQPGDRVGC